MKRTIRRLCAVALLTLATVDELKRPRQPRVIQKVYQDALEREL